MVKYGLVGSFVVDRNMTIRTVSVNKIKFNEMLKKSILHILAWIQRTALISNKFPNLRSLLIDGVSFDYELNRKLILYYATRTSTEKINIEDIKNTKGHHCSSQIINNNIYISAIPHGDKINIEDTKYMIFVEIEHEKHKDIVPLLSLNDL